MSFKEGLENGKKSQSPIWLLSGPLTWIGIILIYNFKKPNKYDFKNESDEYFEGFKKGVIKRRWSYFFGSFILLTFLSGIFQNTNGDTTKLDTSNNINLITTPQRTTIEGVYYQKNIYGEYTTEIKNNGTYIYKSYENGEETYSESGRWKIITVEKKSLKESNSYDLIVFDNKTCLEITDSFCLSGVSNEVSNIIWTPKYNLFPSDGDLLSSLNMWSPIQLSSYQNLCYDDELSRN